MDLTEAIEKIVELNQKTQDVKLIDVHGLQHYYDPINRELKRVLKEEEYKPESITFGNLSGFCEYINSNPDGWDISKCHIVVAAHNRVDLYAGIRRDVRMRRDILATVTCPDCDFMFSSVAPGRSQVNWYDLLGFIISLQSQFVASDNVRDIISVMGNLANEKIIENKDNQFSQTLQVRQGVTEKSEVKIKNPVVLKPYRTFIDVEQPDGEFILRYQESSSKPFGIECALFSADGGRWKLKAIDNICKYIQARTKDIPVLS